MKNKINNPSWNFYLDKLNTYAYWEKVFTKEECEKIIKIAKDKGLIKGTTKGTAWESKGDFEGHLNIISSNHKIKYILY